MRKEKRERLERAGYKVTDTQEFLGLSDAEMAMIEVRISLARALKKRRLEQLKVSQEKFAERIGSSQSRVAKMEAGDHSVSIDLLMRALFVTGVTKKELGRVISAKVA